MAPPLSGGGGTSAGPDEYRLEGRGSVLLQEIKNLSVNCVGLQDKNTTSHVSAVEKRSCFLTKFSVVLTT